MKKSIFFVLFIIAMQLTCAINCTAQTYVKVLLGGDLAKMVDRPNLDKFEIYNEKYSNKSLSFGLGVEQKLFKRFSINALGYFSIKYIPAEVCFNCIAPVKGFAYNYFKNTISLSFDITGNWFIGVGPSYNLITNIDGVFRNTSNREYLGKNKTEYGGLFFIGYKYKKFSIELSYHKGFALSKGNDSKPLFEPINSFGLHLGYKFMVIKNSIKGKDINCPKF